MKRAKQILMLTIIMVMVIPSIALALMTDKDGRWHLMGKLKPQATFRTEDVPDNNPIPIKAGDMISQRNLLMLEFKHDIGEVWHGIDMAYYLQGRAFYDGVWDYGPHIFSDNNTRSRYCLCDAAKSGIKNRHQIKDFKWDAEFFDVYVDLTSGPLFARIGRQSMSWGEMSTIRILDGTNPMDTSSLSVDLLERLIPLWMARLNLAFDFVGPFESLSVQTYYIPGKIDNTYQEDMIDGSAVIPTIGRDMWYDRDDPWSMISLKDLMYQVDDDLEDDRYGVKIGAQIGGVDANLAYYRMYSDMPVPRVNIDKFSTIHVDHTLDLTNPLKSVMGDQLMEVVLTRDTVDVYGGSFNYQWDLINTVVRGEAAFFKDVPKMTPGTIPDMVKALAPKIDLGDFGSIDELIQYISFKDAKGRDPMIMKLPFTCGEILKNDIIKYGIGFDKWFKIPLISPSDFMCSLEYVGSKNLDYKKNTIILPWSSPWDDNMDGYYDVTWEEEYSNTFIFITTTNYLTGDLAAQLVAMYEVEPKALVLIPSVKYSWRSLDFYVSYFMTKSEGYEGTLGMLDSRDEATFSITYNF